MAKANEKQLVPTVDKPIYYDLPEEAKSELDTAMAVAEREMWALVTKLNGHSYENNWNQLTDAERVGELAGKIRKLREAKSIAHKINVARKDGAK